jgi:hypothetical protein
MCSRGQTWKNYNTIGALSILAGDTIYCFGHSILDSSEVTVDNSL